MMIGLGSDKNVSESALKTFWGKSSEMLIFHQRRENLSAQKDNFGGSSQDIFLFAILSIISSCHCSPLLQYFQLESASLFNSDEIIDVFAKFSSILFVIASSRNLLRYWYYSASREFSHHCFPTPTKCIIAFHNVNQKGSKMNNTQNWIMIVQIQKQLQMLDIASHLEIQIQIQLWMQTMNTKTNSEYVFSPRNVLQMYSEIWLPDFDSEKWLSSLFSIRLNCKKDTVIIIIIINVIVVVIFIFFIIVRKLLVHFLFEMQKIRLFLLLLFHHYHFHFKFWYLYRKLLQKTVVMKFQNCADDNIIKRSWGDSRSWKLFSTNSDES